MSIEIPTISEQKPTEKEKDVKLEEVA